MYVFFKHVCGALFCFMIGYYWKTFQDIYTVGCFVLFVCCSFILERNMISLGWGRLSKECWLFMNMVCRMSYCCSWEQHFLNCKLLLNTAYWRKLMLSEHEFNYFRCITDVCQCVFIVMCTIICKARWWTCRRWRWNRWT